MLVAATGAEVSATGIEFLFLCCLGISFLSSRLEGLSLLGLVYLCGVSYSELEYPRGLGKISLYHTGVLSYVG